MKEYIQVALAAILLLLSTSCNQNEQARERDRAHQIAVQTERDARELGRETKRAASELSDKTKSLADRAQVHVDASGESAGTKLRRGTAKLRDAGEDAVNGLQGAALAARVKTKLAASVGLTAAANIHVETSGMVVTLTGDVDSSSQKQAAGSAASSIEGVTRVANHLRVASH